MMLKRIRKIIQVVCILVFCISALLLRMILSSDGGNASRFRMASREAGMKNPIDFEKLQEINPDIYAWIQVPGTRIDYPVASVTGTEEEDYYLNHNFRKVYEFAGTIYSRKENARELSDPVTVLYGHNMINGSMFAGIKSFEDKQFFENHDKVYVFTPEQCLTYQIVSYYESDNKDILQHYGLFQNKNLLEDYHRVIKQPENGFARKKISLGADDRILTLSTCSPFSTRRRLLQTVLTESRLWENAK